MKKNLIGELFVAGAISGIVALLNWTILLNLHDFAYYYTVDGLKIVSIVAMSEALIFWRPAAKFFDRIIEMWEEVEKEKRRP